jgi:hypothetical protein
MNHLPWFSTVVGSSSLFKVSLQHRASILCIYVKTLIYKKSRGREKGAVNQGEQ